jgi:peptide-methionine (S)-S-oxide reductase
MKLGKLTCVTFFSLLLGLPAAVASPPLATTVLAGGCFWCMESDFDKLDGVVDVVSGFAGGTASNPTYSGDHTGHYEVVRVSYDPARVSYEKILEHFWVNIDPFDARGQFCDKGPSYLSAVFVANDEERKTAEVTRARVVARFPDKKVVTPILDAATFYPIKGREAGHQDYAKNNPARYKYYRWGCGRDRRLKAIWGDDVTH